MEVVVFFVVITESSKSTNLSFMMQMTEMNGPSETRMVGR